MSGTNIFSCKPFQEITREERHFCFLLGHSLLSSFKTRQSFVSLVGKKSIRLDENNMKVFVEVAVLRDYWHKLGNPRTYCKKTHNAREKVLRALLKHQDQAEDMFNKYHFFWSAGIDYSKLHSSGRWRAKGSKLHSPGRWSVKLMESELKDDPDAVEKLRALHALKLAFNAKPDFLIISGKEALMIEAKVESGIGSYGSSGQNQLATQRFVAELLINYVPSFRGIKIVQLTLGKAVSEYQKETPIHLTWDEISKCVDEEVDPFTRNSLAGLAST